MHDCGMMRKNLRGPGKEAQRRKRLKVRRILLQADRVGVGLH
jgi:hypothetical protein